MNTKSIEELVIEYESEEKKLKSLSKLTLDINEKVFNGNMDHDIPYMLAFYEHIKKNHSERKYKDKLYSDVIKESNAKYVNQYYTYDKIKNEFSLIISDPDLLDAIFNMAADEVLKNFIIIAEERSNSHDIEVIKNICSAVGKDKLILDYELDKNVNDNDISAPAKNIIDKINEFNDFEPVKAVEYEDNGELQERFDKKVNSALEKINEKVKEEGYTEIKPLEQSNVLAYDLNYFDSKPLSKEERQKRYDQINSMREEAKKENLNNDENTDFKAKAEELTEKGYSITEKDLKKISSKNKIGVEEIEAVILSSSSKIQSLSQKKFGRILSNLYLKLRITHIKKESQKIASTENAFLDVVKRKQALKSSVSESFVDTKNNVKQAIKNVFNSIHENTKAIYNSANKTYHKIKDAMSYGHDNVTYSPRDIDQWHKEEEKLKQQGVIPDELSLEENPSQELGYLSEGPSKWIFGYSPKFKKMSDEYKDDYEDDHQSRMKA